VSAGAPKILAVASAVDLDFRYGCTPAWWQLWKGLTEAGCDLIVTPYRGRAVESPWWRTEPNPCYREAEAFAAGRAAIARLKGDRYLRRGEDHPPDTLSDRLVRETIWRWVTPRWQRHLERILERERDVDAIVVFTVPMSHIRGIPTALRERFGVPVVYYDGDVPMSLPEFGGQDTGFNYYHGADPGEYDLLVSNSEGGLGRLRALGARRAEVVFWAADPGLFSPLSVEKESDVYFYGFGDKFRREWMAALVGEPSRRLPDVDFALGGWDFQGDIGRARLAGHVPFNAFNRAISAARINLNITRRAHGTVHASSTCRPFELAMAGATIVSNPHAGIERWFEPGRELLVVEDAEEAIEAYRELLDDPARAEELGRAARERALDEHTYLRRAQQLLELIGLRQRGGTDGSPMSPLPSQSRATSRGVAPASRARLRRAEPLPDSPPVA
jgi:glycosyltransferase involved in cell wall biosynthesis